MCVFQVFQKIRVMWMVRTVRLGAYPSPMSTDEVREAADAQRADTQRADAQQTESVFLADVEASSDGAQRINNKVAAFFDLDKTLLAQSSGLAFARPFYREGLLGRREAIRSGYAQLIFSLSGANDKVTEGLRRELSRLVTGWDTDTVRRIVNETLGEIVDPLVYIEALDAIDDHKARGHAVVIVSASGSDVVEPIAQWLGAHHWVASDLEIEHGRYTGNITFYAHGANKSAAMRQLADTHSWDLASSYAYSDSSTDIPMLEAVGFPHAVNPDSDLRALALERGWPVLKWTRSVSLRERLPKIDRKTGTQLAISAVVIALLWSWTRSRSKRNITAA